MGKYFALLDPKKCPIAQYTASGPAPSSLTWGRHGGPMGTDNFSPTIVRWQVPAGSTGELTPEKKAVTVPDVPKGAFWSSQAVDFSFFDGTAIFYTTGSAASSGELILVDGLLELTRYYVNGLFSVVGVGGMLKGGRLLYTGLSPLSNTASTVTEGALYGADSCETSPRLLCTKPVKVGTWAAGTSGPVTSDPFGNVFAILTKFGGDQELHGFKRSAVARGAGPASGTRMLKVPGYGSELAADGFAVYFQPHDPKLTFPKDALEVVRIPYVINATEGGEFVAPGFPESFLKPKDGTPLSLFVDDKGRLWVGVTVNEKPPSSTFFVLADR